MIDILTPPAWVAGAPCRTDPDAWFSTDTEADARAVCRTCPVMQQCRDWAVTTGQPYGIWGDTDPDQRNTLRRARGLKPVRTGRATPNRPTAPPPDYTSRDAAIARAYQRGTPVDAIAALHGITRRTVHRIVTRHRRDTNRRALPLPAGAAQLDRDDQIQLCRDLGWVIPDIARTLEISPRTVERALARHRQEAAA